MVQTEFVVRCSGRKEYVSTLISGSVVAFVILMFHNWIEFPAEILLGVLLFIVMISLIASFVKAKIQYIDVDSEGVTMHVGLFNKRTVYVPYERITNTNVVRNFVERIFMLGTLEIDTAGTNRKEIVMHNVPVEYLNRVSKTIQKRIQESAKRRR